MKLFSTVAGISLVVAAFSVPATAASGDAPWFVHAGPARLSNADDARIEVLGQIVPGADVRMKPRYTAEFEVGRFVTPGFALSLAAGVPLRQRVGGGGTIRPLGDLGRVTYGPAAAMIQWHPLRNAAVRPYVGAGVAYLHVFDADGAAVQRFHVDDDVGPVIQGGVEVPIRGRWGVFADAKKAFLRTDATGTLGGAPVRARLRLDPLVLHTGVAFHF